MLSSAIPRSAVTSVLLVAWHVLPPSRDYRTPSKDVAMSHVPVKIETVPFDPAQCCRVDETLDSDKFFGRTFDWVTTNGMQAANTGVAAVKQTIVSKKLCDDALNIVTLPGRVSQTNFTAAGLVHNPELIVDIVRACFTFIEWYYTLATFAAMYCFLKTKFGQNVAKKAGQAAEQAAEQAVEVVNRFLIFCELTRELKNLLPTGQKVVQIDYSTTRSGRVYSPLLKREGRIRLY